MKQIIWLRLGLWSLLAGAMIWILWQGVVPNGRISYSANPAHPNDFIQEFSPPARLQKTKQSIIIKKEPVYFNLRTPRSFDKATLILKYRRLNSDYLKYPVIEAGVLVDKTIWRYDLKPVENAIIDNLFTSWSSFRQKDSLLLVSPAKSKLVNSWQDFWRQPPLPAEVAVYNFSWQPDFRLLSYQPQPAKRPVLTAALRGAFQFFVYIKNEKLDFDFLLEDLNQNQDKDPIHLQLYYRDQLLNAWQLPDDGKEMGTGKSAARKLVAQLSGLPEGVYKLELRVNQDIITRQILTPQHKLAFLGPLWLWPNQATSSSSVRLWTNGLKLQAKSTNPASLGTIKAGKNAFEFNQTFKQFEWELSSAKILPLSLPAADIIVSSDGLFAFGADNLFDPRPPKLSALTVPRLNASVYYILANYQPPVLQKDGWQQAKLIFDLGGAYRENQKYNFIISIPGLNLSDTQKGGIEIKKIMVELEGKNLFSIF